MTSKAHQLCPSRHSRHPDGAVIVCSRCSTRVRITGGCVPEHEIRCGQRVYHGSWPEPCSRYAVAHGYCKQHQPFIAPGFGPER